MDWQKIGEEAVELTRGYLRVNTTNPPGGETAGTRFLAQVLDGAGMASETSESACRTSTGEGRKSVSSRSASVT